MNQLKIYKKEQSDIFAGVPERKNVEIIPTLNQAENGFDVKESKQNEKYLGIVKSKQEVIVRRLKELNQFNIEDWDEATTEKLILKIEKLEEDEIRGDGRGYNTLDHEYNDTESIDSFDSGFQNTDLGIIDDIKHQVAGEYLPKLRKRNELTVVPIETIMKKA